MTNYPNCMPKYAEISTNYPKYMLNLSQTYASLC